uniref:Tuberoinfundibular peptide of 39 residues n=1 Tax=Loxodonta africana TaxID=9785 RepID=G3U9Q5_LOXAF
MLGVGQDLDTPQHSLVLICLFPTIPVPWGVRRATGVALPPVTVLSETLTSGPPAGAWVGPGTHQSRRSLALADDAAFQERARLLAALERRHWLNSYMRKLLVLDAA